MCGWTSIFPGTAALREDHVHYAGAMVCGKGPWPTLRLRRGTDTRRDLHQLPGYRRLAEEISRSICHPDTGKVPGLAPVDRLNFCCSAPDRVLELAWLPSGSRARLETVHVTPWARAGTITNKGSGTRPHLGQRRHDGRWMHDGTGLAARRAGFGIGPTSHRHRSGYPLSSRSRSHGLGT